MTRLPERDQDKTSLPKRGRGKTNVLFEMDTRQTIRKRSYTNVSTISTDAQDRTSRVATGKRHIVGENPFTKDEELEEGLDLGEEETE